MSIKPMCIFSTLLYANMQLQLMEKMHNMKVVVIYAFHENV